LVARVAAQVRTIVRPRERLLVGLSGGVDSVVLLDSLHRLARTLGFRLSALHVNHQLSSNAGRWSAFCRSLCRARGIPFRVVKVRVPRGNSVEAAARAARYEAFAGAAADYIVLAHHKDDQAETVLLQLLRGAGVKGLAAMPLLRREEGRGLRVKGTTLATRHSTPDTRPSTLVPRHSTLDTRHATPAILRPLLDVTRNEILEYAKKRKLTWVEDESNQDIHFLRNYLRHEVLPVISRRFPAYRATLARAAQHLAEASRLLDETAAADGAGTLAVEALRGLPPARARNLLRHFLAGHGLSMPAAGRLHEALRQALGAKQDARVRIDLGDFELHRFRGRLHVAPLLPPVRKEYTRRWRGERSLALPELGGVLAMTPSRGQGVSLERLRGGAVTIRVRRGGERLQPDCRRPRRSLKNLLQEERVPPWQRGHLPLIFCGEELVWTAGVGVDCRYQAAGVEPAIRPVWGAGAETRLPRRADRRAGSVSP
jgi:tRNA(Ile)-lysidine synthase